LIKQIKLVYGVLELREINADTYIYASQLSICRVIVCLPSLPETLSNLAYNSEYGSAIIAGVT